MAGGMLVEPVPTPPPWEVGSSVYGPPPTPRTEIAEATMAKPRIAASTARPSAPAARALIRLGPWCSHSPYSAALCPRRRTVASDWRVVHRQVHLRLSLTRGPRAATSVYRPSIPARPDRDDAASRTPAAGE